MSNELGGEVRVASEADIVDVRRALRNAVGALGFGVTDVTRIVTAASELTRNIFLYAESGEVHWRRLELNGHVGIEVTFRDRGPGIPDVDAAMEPGYSTGGGLGLGLPGARRLVDEMEIESEAGKGTTVRIEKWLRRRA